METGDKIDVPLDENFFQGFFSAYVEADQAKLLQKMDM